MPLLRLLLLTLFFLAAPFAQAAGFTRIEVPADAQGPALRGAVWTPCATPATNDCPVSGGQLPLVVVSHGYGGSFLGHQDTAQALADAGFVVAAISHSSDNYQIRGGPNDRISALATRTTDIKRLIDYMLQQWPSRSTLAADKIGFFGFSRGGYTGLVLGGAVPDFGRLPPLPSANCASAPTSPPCVLMQESFKELLATPLAHDARIKAAVIADPFSPVFDAQGLKNVTIPIQLWASAYGGDGVTPESVAAVRRNLPVSPEWHLADNAAHFGFLPPCSTAQIAAKLEICHDEPGFDRAAFHAILNAKVVAFFKQQLLQAPNP